MSILRHFNKYHGYDVHGKRTPFGGGNPISDVTNSISDVLGTNGGQSGILGNIEAAGQTASKGLSQLDTFVNRELPGGWALPAIIAAAYLTGGGSLAAEGAAEGGTMAAGAEGAGGTVGSLGAGGSFVPAEGASFTVAPGAAYTTAGATAAGEAAYNSALQNGLSQIEATNAANQAAANYTYNLSGQGITSQSGQQAFFDALAKGSNAQEALNQGIAAQYSGQGLTVGEDLANIMKNYPNMSADQLQQILQINYQTDPFLSADAANLAKNGLSADALNQVLGYSYSPTELSGTGIESLQNTLPGQAITNQLGNAKKAYDIVNLLRQGATSGLSSSIGKLAQGANPWGQELTSIVRGNQNPFTQEQYFQVSNPQPNNNAGLVNILKQG
jgi:hypothetical protein